MLGAGSAPAAAEPDLIINVRVYNYAKVSSGVLGNAGREASRIIGTAGVDVAWIDCLATRSASLATK